MAPSPFRALTLLFLLTTASSHPLQPYVRINDRLARITRDEVFIDTPGTPQNLCGDSTLDAVDWHHGPLRDDCEYLRNTVKQNTDGFWMASKFGRNGTAWVEFTRLRTCGIEVRRTDGWSSDVPVGDEDIVDLVNSVVTEFSGKQHLPTVQGQMTCSRDGATAAVEWQIFGV